MEKWNNFDEFVAIYRKHNHLDATIGLRMETLKDGEFCYLLTVDDRHLSSPHSCHGGVLSAMMDATLGLVALAKSIPEDKVCSTVEFKINYLSPAYLGDVLRGTGKVEFKGASLIVCTGDIINIKDEKLIAKGMGTFNLYPVSKKAKLYGIST